MVATGKQALAFCSADFVQCSGHLLGVLAKAVALPESTCIHRPTWPPEANVEMALTQNLNNRIVEGVPWSLHVGMYGNSAWPLWAIASLMLGVSASKAVPKAEGPSMQYRRLLATRTMHCMVFATRNLKPWASEPPGLCKVLDVVLSGRRKHWRSKIKRISSKCGGSGYNGRQTSWFLESLAN